jgi:hypothetical protein
MGGGQVGQVGQVGQGVGTGQVTGTGFSHVGQVTSVEEHEGQVGQGDGAGQVGQGFGVGQVGQVGVLNFPMKYNIATVIIIPITIPTMICVVLLSILS